MDNNSWYNLARIVDDIFMIALLKTLFFDAKNVTDNVRRNVLLITVIVFALNFFGIYRNSFTLWKYQDFMSYFWLASDILQLVFCTIIYAVVYMKDKLDNKASMFVLVFALIFFVLNTYNFLVNFSWLPYEGIMVFIFWFMNNGAMIAFSALVAYFIFSKRMIYET